MWRIIAAALLIAGCQQAPEATSEDANSELVANNRPQEAVAADSVAACTERGVAYFKAIGSYPTLSSAPNAGRSAREVAAERCGRTLTAF